MIGTDCLGNCFMVMIGTDCLGNCFMVMIGTDCLGNCKSNYHTITVPTINYQLCAARRKIIPA
jgi:hypothetical protein